MTYILDTHPFTDKLIMEYLDGKHYSIIKPTPNRFNNCHKLPSMENVLYSLDYSRESSDDNQDDITYAISKVLPNICSSRFMERMIMARYDRNPEFQRLLNQVLECSLLGLYPHCNHHSLLQNPCYIISMYNQMYSASHKQSQVSTLTPGPKFRHQLMHQVGKNEKVLIAVIREFFVHAVSESSVAEWAMRNVVWKEPPFAPWDDYRIHTLHNTNLIRKYMTAKGSVPHNKKQGSEWMTFLEQEEEQATTRAHTNWFVISLASRLQYIWKMEYNGEKMEHCVSTISTTHAVSPQRSVPQSMHHRAKNASKCCCVPQNPILCAKWC